VVALHAAALVGFALFLMISRRARRSFQILPCCSELHELSLGRFALGMKSDPAGVKIE
jgi:hypothetical protein